MTWHWLLKECVPTKEMTMHSGESHVTKMLLVMFLILVGNVAIAEKRPLSKIELEETATHVVVGKVQATYSRKQRTGNYEYTRYLAEVKIDKQEKGEGPDDLIYVRYFTISWQGAGHMPPGPSGHYPLPKQGGTYRFYLSRKAYDGFSLNGNKDGGYNVVYRNGAQPADSQQRPKPDETKPGPRETFLQYFQAMDARETRVANALKGPRCTDDLHLQVHNLDIADRLQPFYELSTPDQALVVAHPFTISSRVLNRQEVIYAQFAKQNGAWRIQQLNRTSPENASWLMKGFQTHSDVSLDLSPDALVGEWWYPCDSTVVLKANGTGTELDVGPVAPPPDQKPEPFTWAVNGSVLTRSFADRKDRLVITSIDHSGVTFRSSNATGWNSWTRKVAEKEEPRNAAAKR
jgi:hypothetical protein